MIASEVYLPEELEEWTTEHQRKIGRFSEKIGLRALLGGCLCCCHILKLKVLAPSLADAH